MEYIYIVIHEDEDEVWICCISATYGDLHTADGRFITVPVITFGIE